MQQYVKDAETGGDKVRACVLEPSSREFAMRDCHAKDFGQFGPRVHLAPSSPAGKAHMHNSGGGFSSSCDNQVGWGVPLSLSRSSSVEIKPDGSQTDN
eukprot:6904863-Karenia_brevis.AAC.1